MMDTDSMPKLTDKITRSLSPPERGNRIVYDSVVKGFGLRVTANDSRAFIINYRRKTDRLERRYTIGAFPDWAVVAAREKAKELKRHIDEGGDPVGEHVAALAAPTVADLCERFTAEHFPELRPATRRDYSAIVAEIKSAIGRMKVAAVDFEHVKKLHREITVRAPYRANRTLAVLSKMLSLAILWKYRSDNPTKGIKRNIEGKRKRYLSAAELVRLCAALDQHGGQAADVFRLLLLTGARAGEALSATWTQFNADFTTWTRLAHATKQKQDHIVPLSAPVRMLLGRIREQQGASETLVFPGRNGHRTDLKHAWRKVCAAADITGLRIHDLRHSFASQLVSGGASLPLIGALLGHSNPATTHRYSHLYDDPQRDAVEHVGAIIAGKAHAKVIPLPLRRRRVR
jgi:integrase